MRKKQDKINIDYLAQLSQLELEEKEKQRLEKQLKEVIDYFGQLEKIDTSKTVSTAQTTERKNVFQEEKTEKRQLLSLAGLKLKKRLTRKYFVIPRIIDREN